MLNYFILLVKVIILITDNNLKISLNLTYNSKMVGNVYFRRRNYLNN